MAGMPAKLFGVWFLCVACICYGVLGQNNDVWCYEFTWLGPTFTNESRVNGTCEDFDKRVCVDPLVYTYDGSPPNLTYMWMDTEIKSRVGCKLAKGQVCARYSYIYNNEYENVTYMCTKVTIDRVRAMESGCERQFVDGRYMEVCACNTYVAGGIPCNDGAALRPNQGAAAALLGVLLVAAALRR